MVLKAISHGRARKSQAYSHENSKNREFSLNSGEYPINPPDVFRQKYLLPLFSRTQFEPFITKFLALLVHFYPIWCKTPSYHLLGEIFWGQSGRLSIKKIPLNSNIWPLPKWWWCFIGQRWCKTQSEVQSMIIRHCNVFGVRKARSWCCFFRTTNMIQ